MTMRIGLGPVFVFERLIQARRWQTYAARSLLVALLLSAMAMVARTDRAEPSESLSRKYARLGESHFYSLIGVELTLVLLVSPVAAAGAICVDRARGTLAHLMSTDLSDTEIVLGKLAARIMPVLLLVACTWPVMAISSLLGGIDPVALMLAFAIMVAVAVVGSSTALALSVWARKPHEVVLAIYFAWLVSLLAGPIWQEVAAIGLIPRVPRVLLLINPYSLAFSPYESPSFFDFWDYVAFFGGAFAISVIMLALAIWRIRPVAVRASGTTGRSHRMGWLGRLIRSIPGPRLDGNPVLWREWHRARPSRFLTIVVAPLAIATTVACLFGSYSAWKHGITPMPPPTWARIVEPATMIPPLFGLLILSAVAPYTFAEERQRGGLDVLTATPLSNWTIVLGKWLGTFRLVPLIALGPGLVAFAVATARENPGIPPATMRYVRSDRGSLLACAALLVVTILAHGALLSSVGLALATWIKRPARAMAVSVMLFIGLSIAWPIFTRILPARSGFFANLSVLSPIVSTNELAGHLFFRNGGLPSRLWWNSLCVLVLAATAIGILWLTWRTFDLGIGRIPERPRTTPILADVFTVYAAILAIAFTYLGISRLAVGMTPHSLDQFERAGLFCCELPVLFGVVLLAAVVPLFLPAVQARVRRDRPIPTPRSSVTAPWIRSFQLLGLLALGPILVALGLAFAPERPNLAGVPTALSTRSAPPPTAAWVAIPPASRGVVLLPERLLTVIALTLTTLTSGAVVISAGLLIGRWVRPALIASLANAGLCLFVVVGLPILGLRGDFPVLGPCVYSTALLIDQLVTREPQLLGVIGWPAIGTSIITNLFVAGILLVPPAVATGLRRRLHLATNQTDQVEPSKVLWPPPPIR
jgi:ABC-type transport system involved in multi-copper enzyme maturation permease subunit